MGTDAKPTGNKLKLYTPRFRVSFPEVFQKKQFDESQPARWSLTGLFTPSEFDDADKARWKALGAAINALCKEHTKKTYNDIMGSWWPLDYKARQGASPTYRMPFHAGEEKTYKGYGPGIVFFAMAASKQKPQVVSKKTGQILTENSEDAFYAGCYARATVNPYFFDNKGKGIAIGLNNLLKLDEGERLDSFSSAEEDFGDEMGEYGGGGDDFSETGSEDAGGDFDPTA